MKIKDIVDANLIAEFLALHRPERQADHMVYEVWQDGEITLTKGADLWRQRSLHCIRLGVRPEFAMPFSRMPIQYGDNGSIIVASDADANRAHEIAYLYATTQAAAREGSVKA